jgi:hypothetical protein
MVFSTAAFTLFSLPVGAGIGTIILERVCATTSSKHSHTACAVQCWQHACSISCYSRSLVSKSPADHVSDRETDIEFTQF